MSCKYFVYLIKSKEAENTYTGFTTDLSSRLKQHNSDISKYTRGKGPWELVWYAAFNNRGKALDFEKYLKSGSGYAFSRRRFL
jgi:putative endonuclease